MRKKRYRHKEFGRLHKLDLSKGGIGTTLMWDAQVDGLTAFLSDASQQGDKHRVLILLEAMLKLDGMEEPAWSEEIDGPMTVKRDGRWGPNPLLKKVAPKKWELQMRIDRLRSVVNDELRRYPFIPYADRMGNKGRWIVMWLIRSQAPSSSQGTMEVDVPTAVQLILDLARAGQLWRLRRCSRCQKWLFATLASQVFCSKECQEKHYKSSEEWRAKRRNYMRKYRSEWTKSERKAK